MLGTVEGSDVGLAITYAGVMRSLALTTSVVGTTGRNQMLSKAIKTQFLSFDNLNPFKARSHLFTVSWHVMITAENT